MWTFASERRLSAAAWGALAALFAAAFAFHGVQNGSGLVGGAISWPKLFWLFYAIAFWFVLPALIVADARLARAWRRPFLVLFWMMLARGIVEGWMLYVSLNWSPWYGIAHDAVCATLLLALAVRLAPRSRLEQAMLFHLGVTALLFAPEIYYAWYMQAHFDTRGPSAVYFVPDDPAHAFVLRVTTAVDLALTCYLPVFLFWWLHGTPARTRSAAL